MYSAIVRVLLWEDLKRECFENAEAKKKRSQGKARQGRSKEN